ncbi:hypothetical protein L6452_41248 [Arctium lappa]|uniref:Uncharacterized protein n=1 Tax=Arctium lappa TaxID=4217 RepID=A0ACB8XNN8_ARCLA|nr:hypothetical protein L6452_41248 [Arctium lappa]
MSGPEGENRQVAVFRIDGSTTWYLWCNAAAHGVRSGALWGLHLHMIERLYRGEPRSCPRLLLVTTSAHDREAVQETDPDISDCFASAVVCSSQTPLSLSSVASPVSQLIYLMFWFMCFWHLSLLVDSLVVSFGKPSG